MHLLNNLLLFLLTFLAGVSVLWIRLFNENRMHYLLAFSGSFLLSITFLHLLPETFSELGMNAGLLMLAGFFIQLIIQRITHGLEHGHIHVHHHEHSVSLLPILGGLAIHAFMEGIPLGFSYSKEATEPALYLAITVHKLPEAMLVTTLVSSTKGKKQAILTLLIFSALTPFAGLIAGNIDSNYLQMTRLVSYVVPIVAGAFIHIATTIFFESGTRHHALTWQKIFAILVGVGAGLATLILE
jgi:zinc and cadmium transporter